VIASSSFIILADAGCKNNKTIQESYITFFGFNLWVPMTYAWSAENYPTRARATSIALVDGVGHLGGGVGHLVHCAAHPYPARFTRRYNRVNRDLFDY
jgi:hypothetical protein